MQTFQLNPVTLNDQSLIPKAGITHQSLDK